MKEVNPVNLGKRAAQRRERDAYLSGLFPVQLHAELSRCVGDIIVCTHKRNYRGARRAWRAMKPVMREMRKRNAASVAAPTAKRLRWIE